ncbi:MAG: YeeE/YedE family protein [Thermomicrobiales bacterium]
MTSLVLKPASVGTFFGRVSRQHIAAILVLFSAIALAFPMADTEAILPALWFLGMAAGFTLQRSRFCFASAFRDLFLFGSGRTLKGILLGLSVATVGFAIVMYNEVPFPEFGARPAEAHVLPVGLSTVVGGLLFGFGMVISGGCVSGSLYRAAEGYVASAVTLLGIMIGLGVLSRQWNWWWDTVIRHEPMVWLPARFNLGYAGAVVLTLAGILGVYLFVTWWEARNGVIAPTSTRPAQPAETFGERIGEQWRRVFVAGWSPAVGGAVLGVLGILMYMVHMPWGVTGELSRWSTSVMDAAGAGPGELRGLSDLGGCALLASESGFFTHTFALTVGLMAGALIAALFAREFKLRLPRQRRRYAQSLGGGVVMGYGAGLGIGCTIGAFFSAIPSFSVSGWLFAVSLAGGAYFGVAVIRRIP